MPAHADPHPVRRRLHPDTPPWLVRFTVFALLAYWLSRGLVTAAVALEPLLVVLVMSFVVASAFEVPVAWLSRRMPRGFAAALSIGAAAALGFGLIIAAGVSVAHQVSSLVKHFPRTLDTTLRFVNRHLHTHLTSVKVRADLSHLNLLHSHLTASALTSLTQLASLLMGVLFTFYFVAEGPQIRENLCSLLPPAHQPEMLRVLTLTVQKSGAYFFSRLVLSLVRFIAALAVLVATHTGAPIILAAWYALLSEFIPVIGTTLATALPVLVAAAVSVPGAVVVLGCLLVVTAVRNYVLAPKLTRHTVRLHPAVSFGAVVAAAVLFGPLAALMAVPVLAVLTSFFSVYLHRHDVVVDADVLPGSPGAQ